MALVRVQRSPGAAGPESGSTTSIDDDDEFSRSGKSLSQCCYFASKGAAVVLPGGGGRGIAGNGRTKRSCSGSSDIQLHLQSMFDLLRSKETLKMAVKLESVHPQRTRYLVVVSRSGVGGAEEACLLGIDCNDSTTVGLVLRVFADTAITLDGDGGFSVTVCGSQHIFKPVSVQAMWSALQMLHRASGTAREQNYFQGGNSHDWVSYYEQHIQSDRSCLNEWHAMDSIESRRPPSPDSVRTKPRERDETERVIKNTLKEIMMSVDIDEVTSKVIRGRLEEDLDMDLGEFKSFIDVEMMTILGQMDAPTEIFDHVYLGSEWNASNLEELQKNGVRHILNVTREIDNFFPGMFNYHNVRVYDDEKTDLLKYWDKTFKYISKAKEEGSKVLVHCKMGVSRSASVVIAYAMKAYDWKLDKAINHVKAKRTCIKPNTSFITQLETYQGILDAMKNRDKLQRSKSETNLKSPGMVSKTDSSIMEPMPFIQALSGRCRGRPRSWSPDTRLASQILPPASVSLENLAPESGNVVMKDGPNGSYSVSQNQIMHLNKDVKTIVYSFESQATNERKKLRERSNLKLNLGQEFDRFSAGHCNDCEDIEDKSSDLCDINMGFEPIQSGDAITNNIQSRLFMDKKDTWDPGESTIESKKKYFDSYNDNKDLNEIVKCDSGVMEMRGRSRHCGDPFSKQVDHVFDKEERQHGTDCEGMGAPPSRQSSWSSCDSAVVLEKLSRNSSCGSYDNKPSRNSSMGSYDEQCHTGTVKRTKQKLEDSCINKTSCSDLDTVAYNGAQEIANTVSTHKLLAPTCDLDIIKENFEQSCKKPIKTNSNGISDSVINNNRLNNRLGAILKEPDFNRADDFCNTRKQRSFYTQLSASAPTGSCITNIDRHSFRPSSSYGNISSIKPTELIDTAHIQTSNHKNNGSKNDTNTLAHRNSFGKVMNLKIKFESNLHGKDDVKNVNSDVEVHSNSVNGSNSKGKSLPSSPVSVHNDKKAQLEPDLNNKNNFVHTTSLEDLSVKDLVGKYDRPKSQQFTAKLSSEPPVPMRKSSLNRDVDSKAQKKQSVHSPRNSLCEILKNTTTIFRPPVGTAMSTATFSNNVSHPSKIQRKQIQHGKSHPLTKLNFNKNHTTNRCINPAYNTM